jgi:transposase InsO family protein
MARGDDSNSTRRLPARYRNHIWSYDFIKRRAGDGRPVRVLNVIDEFTRVGLGSHAARAIGSKGVKHHLEYLFKKHGKPTPIRADNGREFIADSLLDWLGEQQVRGVFIAKASPWQNGINERINGTMERAVRTRDLPLDPGGPGSSSTPGSRSTTPCDPIAAWADRSRRHAPRCSRKRLRTTEVVVADKSTYQHCPWTSRNHPVQVPVPDRINQ